MWAQLSGDWRRLASDGNAPRLNQSSTSLTIGGDAAVGGGWRLGGAFGYTDARLSARDRAASAKIGSYTATLYGGKGYALGAGTLNLTFGGAYSWHDIDSRRGALRQPGPEADRRLPRQHHAALRRDGLCDEAGRCGGGRAVRGPGLERSACAGFNESGGSAALSGQAQKQRLTTSLAGVRGQWQPRARPSHCAACWAGVMRLAACGPRPRWPSTRGRRSAWQARAIARDAAQVELRGGPGGGPQPDGGIELRRRVRRRQPPAHRLAGPALAVLTHRSASPAPGKASMGRPRAARGISCGCLCGTAASPGAPRCRRPRCSGR